VARFFCLTAFFRLGTVILESKQKAVCLIKPCRCPCKLNAALALNQYGNTRCPQERAIEFITRMLSRKKGRRYGEGHQKALQISIGMLPLVRLSVVEGATCLPGRRHKRNAWYVFSVCLFFTCCWKSVFLPTRWLCREDDDGLSGHEATEISSLMLLRRWRSYRWEELQLFINRVMWCRHTRDASIHVASREDGHPTGWPLLFCFLRWHIMFDVVRHDLSSQRMLSLKNTPGMSRDNLTLRYVQKNGSE